MMQHALIPPVVQLIAPSRHVPPLPGARVLVVDDDPDSRTSMTLLLKQAGLSVVGAASAREALAAVEGPKFDLAIIDIVLPDVRGDELLQALRAHDESNQKLPAIAVTGYGSYENQERIRQAGFDAYVIKPADYRRLLDIIARLIEPTS